MIRRFITHIITSLAAVAAPAAAWAGHLSFSGYTHAPVEIIPDKSTGIDAIYVVDGNSGLTMTYHSQSASSTVTYYWMARDAFNPSIPFDENGAIDHNGATEWTFKGPVMLNGCYIISENGKREYYWILDYNTHPFDIHGIAFADEQDCGMAMLIPDGDAPPLTYYSINQRLLAIDRQILVEYDTQQPDTESMAFATIATSQSLESISGAFYVPAPLTDTAFHILGDRFTRAWGINVSVTSDIYRCLAVDAITRAEQAERDVDNEVKPSVNLGGSAPVDITFTAAVSDAAVFHEWQLSRDPEFIDIDLRTTEFEWTYCFREMGNFHVRFVAANAGATCEYFGEDYEVSIGESRLLCPNAFSPGATEGINDEWRVSYQSIVDFECYIFNRSGVKMAELHDPSQGWDGRHKGKLVPAGVYYYVIKAIGSDGRKYNLSGDINIINYR